jgi:hypothetical protein
LEEALRNFLEQLEAIEKDHDALGDTDVREHMSRDIMRGFIRIEARFVPSGRYGLGQAGNRRVRDAIAQFVKVARKAAKREGLNSFHQRLAAVQNGDVQTARRADYNDFFGWWDPSWFDAAGNDLRPGRY